MMAGFLWKNRFFPGRDVYRKSIDDPLFGKSSEKP
jgi:hypothetical protein